MVRNTFWDHVLKDPGGCWLWQRGKDRHGYGRLYLGGGRKNPRYGFAHRVAYELVKGPLPEGLNILHLCDTPGCVNPDHLRPGTQAENVADAKVKGRMRNEHSGATHCPAGHPLVEGSYWTYGQSRRCKQCARAHYERTRERKKAYDRKRYQEGVRRDRHI